MKLINIGFGNMVSAGRVVAVVSPDSAPVSGSHPAQLPIPSSHVQ